MSLGTLDTLEVVKELKAAGFSEQQAEAVTRVVRKAQDLDLSHLATKQDVLALTADVEAFKADTRHEFANLRAEMKAALAELKADVIKWVLGIAFAQGAMIVAMLKLLPSGKRTRMLAGQPSTLPRGPARGTGPKRRPEESPRCRAGSRGPVDPARLRERRRRPRALILGLATSRSDRRDPTPSGAFPHRVARHRRGAPARPPRAGHRPRARPARPRRARRQRPRSLVGEPGPLPRPAHRRAQLTRARDATPWIGDKAAEYSRRTRRRPPHRRC